MKFLYIVLLSIFILGNEFDDGFDDEFSDMDIVKVKEVKQKDNPLEIDTIIQLSTSYNIAHSKPKNANFNDFRGLSSLDISINQKMQYKINENYKLKSNIKMNNDFIYQLKSDNYKTIPSGYESEMDVNELYVQGKVSKNIDISLGKQIISWGKADTIRILDVINNTDKRRLGITDIKDLKLGRSMSKIDYFIDNWSFSTMLIHQNVFSKMPQYGSDYAPPKPTNSITPSSEQGIAISILGNLKGQDIGFYYTKQYMDNKNHYEDMVGFSYAKVINSFLLKTDIAYFEDLEDLEIVGGLEYTGFKDKTISLEVAHKAEKKQYALRLNREFLNKSLKWNKFIYIVENMDNMLIRTDLSYDVDDELSVKLGYITYKGDKQPFKLMKDNDRLFGSVKYSF